MEWARQFRQQMLEARRTATALMAAADQLLATGTDLMARARSLRRGQTAPPCPGCGSDRVIPIIYGAARMELLPGTRFAGLWGGGTVENWRGRGVYRALVAHRARVAADRGYRYVQVDALARSRPILARLGFEPLTTTTPHEYAVGRAGAE